MQKGLIAAEFEPTQTARMLIQLQELQKGSKPLGVAQDGGGRQPAALAQIAGKALQLNFHGRRCRGLTCREGASLSEEAAQGTHRATEVRAAGPIITVSRLQLLLRQLSERRDALTPQPAHHWRQRLEVVTDGSGRVALIPKPPDEIVQLGAEDRQRAPTSEGSRTELGKGGCCVHPERNRRRLTPVKNVELDTPRASAWCGSGPSNSTFLSTQHF
jgi:hypothetical protein